MEQDLPVPREDLITRKELPDEKTDKNKVFSLPELQEFLKDTAPAASQSQDERKPAQTSGKVDRKNLDEYLRAIQLNPFADSDDSIFLEEYDIFQSIFGTGKLVNIPIPYLQTGHGILLIICVLAAFVYAPGNPLTEFPPEIRSFLKQGLAVVYSINSVLAVLGYRVARSKNLPGILFALKCFILGGISYFEVTQAKDPAKMNEPVTPPNPSNRKSKNPRSF